MNWVHKPSDLQPEHHPLTRGLHTPYRAFSLSFSICQRGIAARCWLLCICTDERSGSGGFDGGDAILPLTPISALLMSQQRFSPASQLPWWSGAMAVTAVGSHSPQGSLIPTSSQRKSWQSHPDPNPGKEINVRNLSGEGHASQWVKTLVSRQHKTLRTLSAKPSVIGQRSWAKAWWFEQGISWSHTCPWDY